MEKYLEYSISYCHHHYKTLLLILVLFTLGAYIFLDNQFYQRHSGQPSILHLPSRIHPLISMYLSQQFPPEPYLVDTPGCKIESTLIIPEYYKGEWRVEKIPDCDYESHLSVLDDENQILTLNKEYKESGCCFHEIKRSQPDNDNGFKLTDCVPFLDYINVSGKELLLTKCGNSLNFEANFPILPSVEQKLKYWANQSGTPEPYNVLLIGIDTTSRSQALRSLPRTILKLQELNFVDFKGYFAPPGFTEGYFTNFLMGLTFNESRSVCKPNWTVPWDDCPFLWNEFNSNNYVTMYVEDGHQTFNWGGQSGFRARPTDYYIHPLYTAMEELRQEYSGVWYVGNKLDMYAYCASNETVPQFQLRHLSRFLAKFSKQENNSRAPFFTFTWFENPFHDYEYSLGNMDSHFFNFFNQLPSDLLDSTLIMVTGDHGDRTSPFQTHREGPQERYLPAFYVRLPNKLGVAHPEYVEALEWNSVHLTTPFDSHHTILHLLNLSIASRPPLSPFEPIKPDRSSLFFPVSANRSCETINDSVRHCVCAKVSRDESITDGNLLSELLKYATVQLNLIISNSTYASVCEIWRTDSKSSIISSRIIESLDNYDVVLFQFSAKPGSAKFEVKLKIVYRSVELIEENSDKSNMERIEIASDFYRISSYGKQSHCVKFETRTDKMLKEFCYCK